MLMKLSIAGELTIAFRALRDLRGTSKPTLSGHVAVGECTTETFVEY